MPLNYFLAQAPVTHNAGANSACSYISSAHSYHSEPWKLPLTCEMEADISLFRL